MAGEAQPTLASTMPVENFIVSLLPPPEWMKFLLRMTVYFLKPGSGLIFRALLRGDGSFYTFRTDCEKEMETLKLVYRYDVISY